MQKEAWSQKLDMFLFLCFSQRLPNYERVESRFKPRFFKVLNSVLYLLNEADLLVAL